MVPAVDPEAVRQEYRYEALTWPEINEAIRQQKVAVIPVGSVEQHGYHLPLDVDFRLASSVCRAAGERGPANMLVLPPVSYGYCHHVMDFPGTITIQPSTFISFLLDITRSLAYHGFKRIVMVNGHGSNAHLVEQAGRQTNLQTDALCCTLSWWQLVADYWNKEVRTSAPGGCAHACELETSMYLHLNGDGVRTDRVHGALPEFVTNIPGGDEWQWVDLTAGAGPVSLSSGPRPIRRPAHSARRRRRPPKRAAWSSSTRPGDWSISSAGTRADRRRRAASTTTWPRQSRCRSVSRGGAGWKSV